MDERHTFSEPRLIDSNALKWDLDIYRKGVNDPVETILLSDETLPPRLNKRGKIVWRLPTDPGKLPSFGTDEKRRIMDLFKDRKKNRRKAKTSSCHLDNADDRNDQHPKSKSNSSDDGNTFAVHQQDDEKIDDCDQQFKKINLCSDETGGFEDSNSSAQQQDNGKCDDCGEGKMGSVNVVIPKEDDVPPTRHNTVALPSEDVHLGKNNGSVSSCVFNVNLNPSIPTTSKKKKKKKDKKGKKQHSMTHMPETEDVSSSETFMKMTDDDDSGKYGKEHRDQHSPETLQSPPPGLMQVPPPSAPPGFGSTLLSKEKKKNLSPVSSEVDLLGDCATLDDESVSADAAPHDQIPTPSSPLIPPPTMRCIIIPDRDRPKDFYNTMSQESHSSLLNQHKKKISLAVGAAKAFLDLYYPHITHGLSADLAMYYTPHAQKSVSVGGAHSVVSGLPDITTQIASLAGTIFVVRGVVSQDTEDQKGAHILVTGVVQTNALGNTSDVTPFAHSISLVPATINRNINNEEYENTIIPFAFRIHNDALSLMTTGCASNVVPIDHNIQQQNHDVNFPHSMKQPPGLF